MLFNVNQNLFNFFQTQKANWTFREDKEEWEEVITPGIMRERERERECSIVYVFLCIDFTSDGEGVENIILTTAIFVVPCPSTNNLARRKYFTN